MSTRIFILVVLVLMGGCGAPEPAREPFDGSVTFFIDPGAGTEDPGLSEQTMTFLAVEKAGRTTLVDAWAEETPDGVQYGRHNFPQGTTAAAVAGYYGALLTNAGWKTPADFMVGGASIHFYGVRSLQAGADRPGLQVNATP